MKPTVARTIAGVWAAQTGNVTAPFAGHTYTRSFIPGCRSICMHLHPDRGPPKDRCHGDSSWPTKFDSLGRVAEMSGLEYMYDYALQRGTNPIDATCAAIATKGILLPGLQI